MTRDQELCLQRLHKALHYLELARLSRALDFAAGPPVITCETLIKIAIEKQQQNAD